MALLNTKQVLGSVDNTNPSEVFEMGKFGVIFLNTSKSPRPSLVYSPTQKGSYPVILFLHGFCITNTFYSDLFDLISSHGYIIVAPQLYTLPISGTDEIKRASNVISWLPLNLQSLLPEKVEANLDKLCVAGHSRGGKTAFALALGIENHPLKFSALIGIDPVAGTKCYQPEPHILKFEPQSLNISIPIEVIGTGFGPETEGIFKPCPCAPKGFSYAEFFNESKPIRAHFVAADYGHMDILNDNPPGIIGKITGVMCKNGKCPRDFMRKCCSGLVVAFLKAYLDDDKRYLTPIYQNPKIAPAKLVSVQIDEQ